LGKADKLVTPHALYLALGLEGSESARQGEGSLSKSSLADSDPGQGEPVRLAYRALCEEMLSRKEMTAIRRGTNQEKGIGSGDFLLRVAKLASA
jgi:hypothetical protein